MSFVLSWERMLKSRKLFLQWNLHCGVNLRILFGSWGQRLLTNSSILHLCIGWRIPNMKQVNSPELVYRYMLSFFYPEIDAKFYKILIFFSFSFHYGMDTKQNMCTQNMAAWKHCRASYEVVRNFLSLWMTLIVNVRYKSKNNDNKDK